jgi:hypothetical protein
MMTAPTINTRREKDADIATEKVTEVNPAFSKSPKSDMVLAVTGCCDDVSVVSGSLAEVLPCSVEVPPVIGCSVEVLSVVGCSVVLSVFRCSFEVLSAVGWSVEVLSVVGFSVEILSFVVTVDIYVETINTLTRSKLLNHCYNYPVCLSFQKETRYLVTITLHRYW